MRSLELLNRRRFVHPLGTIRLPKSLFKRYFCGMIEYMQAMWPNSLDFQKYGDDSVPETPTPPAWQRPMMQVNAALSDGAPGQSVGCSALSSGCWIWVLRD